MKNVKIGTFAALLVVIGLLTSNVWGGPLKAKAAAAVVLPAQMGCASVTFPPTIQVTNVTSTVFFPSTGTQAYDPEFTLSSNGDITIGGWSMSTDPTNTTVPITGAYNMINCILTHKNYYNAYMWVQCNYGIMPNSLIFLNAHVGKAGTLKPYEESQCNWNPSTSKLSCCAKKTIKQEK